MRFIPQACLKIILYFIISTGIDKLIQIASFHPDYQFADSEASDVTNYTNRSPYPLIHFLRVKDVSTAIDNFDGSTDDIWKSNKKKLRNLGEPKIKQIIASIIEEASICEEVRIIDEG